MSDLIYGGGFVVFTIVMFLIGWFSAPVLTLGE